MRQTYANFAMATMFLVSLLGCHAAPKSDKPNLQIGLAVIPGDQEGFYYTAGALVGDGNLLVQKIMSFNASVNHTNDKYVGIGGGYFGMHHPYDGFNMCKAMDMKSFRALPEGTKNFRHHSGRPYPALWNGTTFTIERYDPGTTVTVSFLLTYVNHDYEIQRREFKWKFKPSKEKMLLLKPLYE